MIYTRVLSVPTLVAPQGFPFPGGLSKAPIALEGGPKWWNVNLNSVPSLKAKLLSTEPSSLLPL